MGRWDKRCGRNIIGREQMINSLLNKLRNCAGGWISIQIMKICSVYSRFLFIYYLFLLWIFYSLPIVFFQINSKLISRIVAFFFSMISDILSSCWKHVLKSIDFITSSKQRMEVYLILEFLKFSCVKNKRCDLFFSPSFFFPLFLFSDVFTLVVQVYFRIQRPFNYLHEIFYYYEWEWCFLLVHDCRIFQCLSTVSRQLRFFGPA